MEASRSRLNVSIWGELTPLSARAHTRPHSLPNSAAWLWALCRNRVWHRANSLRQRSTYGPLSPLRCSARSWYNTESSGTSSALGTMDGYLPRSTAVICNLWGGKIRSSVLASLKKNVSSLLCQNIDDEVSGTTGREHEEVYDCSTEENRNKVRRCLTGGKKNNSSFNRYRRRRTRWWSMWR